MELPDSLLAVSEMVGLNKFLVQGPGGNISYKINNSLFIKASGASLSDALKKNIFVKTNLEKIRFAIENNLKDPLKDSWDNEKNLRPSIETSLHAIMPQRCVLHVHCVNTLSWVVQRDYKYKLLELLDGLRWTSIPYKKPGYELTKALKKAMKKNNYSVILLSNHGLVAGADNPFDVLKLVKDVSKRLYIEPDEFSLNDFSDFKDFVKSINYKFPKYSHIHSLAKSEESILIVAKGILFPDQIVFLGSKIRVIRDFNNFLKSYSPKDDDKSIILIPKFGILVPEDFSETAEEILYGLSLIVERIPNNASINYLNKEEENDLINWDAEKYRKSLNN